jgi:FdhE protein
MKTNSFSQAEVRAYAEQHPAFQELLARFSKLLCAQREMTEQLRDVLQDVDPLSGETLSAGEPLCMNIRPALLLEAFRRSARTLWPTVVQEFPVLQPAFTKITEKLADDSWCMDCLHASVRGEIERLENAAKQADVAPETLLFALRVAYAPCITALRPRLTDQPSVTLWRKSFCPICGADPDLGTLELHADEGSFVVAKSGQAWLHCPKCEHHWRFTRVLCPSCGNKENDQLHRLHLPEIPHEFVYACDACNHYLPFLDLTALPEGTAEPDLYFAALKLIHLDAVAQEKGYEPLSPAPWTVFGFAEKSE